MQVKSYETIEEMWKDLEDQRKLAIESFNNCTKKQKALKEGDIFFTSAYDLVILNQIQTLDPEDEHEFESAKDMGYVMVKAWSDTVPEGEMGSVHRSWASYKLINSEKYSIEDMFEYFIKSWKEGESISKYDLQWINDSKNLEVLV